MSDYAAPVNQLLRLGEPEFSDWPAYAKYGLTAEHIPELIRMATDQVLNTGDPETTEMWAPVHAWRALGQLQAGAAVQPLLGLLDPAVNRDDDWALEELPDVFALIGLNCLPALTEYLADPSHELYARTAASAAIRRLAQKHPSAREQSVAILSRQLEHAASQDGSLNGLLIAELIDLKAVEAAPVMERAFAKGHVDQLLIGDWDYVRYDLGIGPKPAKPRYDFGLNPLPPPPGYGIVRGERDPRNVKSKAKAKRKAAAKARKRNRKRK